MAGFLLQKGALTGGLTCHRNQINGVRLCSPSHVSGTQLNAVQAGKWLPGADVPQYLEDVPGSHGFDPLGLGRNPELLSRFRESELIHSRWAMLGVAGSVGAEILGQGSWTDAVKWVLEGGKPQYVGVELPFDFNFILAVEFLAIGGSESYRNLEPDSEKRKYPGGAFDPLGFAKSEKFEWYKLAELKNGRLAMLAFLGFVSQHSLYNRSPLGDLAKHLENPWTYNYSTNGYSLPFLPPA